MSKLRPPTPGTENTLRETLAQMEARYRASMEEEAARAEYYRLKWHAASGVPLIEIAPDVYETPPEGMQALPPRPDYPPAVHKAPVPRDLPPHPDLPEGLK